MGQLEKAIAVLQRLIDWILTTITAWWLLPNATYSSGTAQAVR